MFSSNKFRVGTTILILLAAGAVFGFFSKGWYQPDVRPENIPGLLWPNPKIIEPFSTIDHTGTPFDLNRLKGKWSLLFFGFTHCPDVCPMTLSILSSLQDRLPEDTQTLFVTVDPERDTTERLADYIGFYDKRMIALGGTLEQVSTLAAQIGVAWAHDEPMADGSYNVTHSSAVLLIDPQARLVGIFSAPLDPQSLPDSILGIRDFISRQQ